MFLMAKNYFHTNNGKKNIQEKIPNQEMSRNFRKLRKNNIKGNFGIKELIF